MSSKDRRRGRVRRTIISTVIVLAALWCGYWYAASYAAAVGLQRMVAAVATHGRTAGCGTQGMAGFPLSLDMQCSAARFTAPAMSADLGKIAVTAPLYRPGHVDADLTAPLVFNAPELGLAVTASWAGAKATADAGLSGLSGASATLTSVTLEQSGTSTRLPFRKVAAAGAEFAAAPGDGDGYRLTGSARDIVVEPASGQKLPVLAGAVDVSALKFGRALGLDPRQTLRAWVASGGGIELTRLTLFLGNASVSASGPLTLSLAGLLSGTLNVRLVGLDQLPDIAEGIRPGSHDRIAQGVAAISAFTKPVKTADGEARDTVLTIHNGAVMAGLFPLGSIPAIKF